MANAIYGGGDTLVGSTDQGVSQKVGPSSTLIAEWPESGGGEQAANSSDPVYVDNTAGLSPILVKYEGCIAGFGLVFPGKRLHKRVDGVKPPAWDPRQPEAGNYTQDWYKVADYLGFEIDANGFATRMFPALWRRALSVTALGGLLDVECHFYDPLCRLAPSDDLYHRLGGRKLELEWSEPNSPWHWEWRWPGPDAAKRRENCGPY